MPLLAWVALLLPAPAHAGTVTGTVTPVEWAQEVEVCEVEKLPSELCTTAGADGSYRLENVPLGAVRIEFIPSLRSRLLTQYYDHKSRLSEATTIFLTAAEPTADHIDADLIEGGVIEGTVTAAGSGTPLGEVEVCAISASAPTVKRCGETDASGVYELHSLPSESYRVAFRGRGENAGYQPQYYDHEQELARSDFISVNAGATAPHVDASLEPGAEIEGIASDADGAPLPGVAVCLFDTAASAADRCTYSGESGSYSFPGLPSGSYQVGFSLEPGEAGIEAGVEADGFESQYYDGVGSRAEATTISALAPALVSGVDAHLSAPPQLSPAPPPSSVASPVVAAPAVIAVPKPPAKRCKKGFRKKMVKGKVRCVRVQRRRHRHRQPNSYPRGLREVVQEAGVRVHFDGGISPTKLPRSGSRGVRVSLETRISAAGRQTRPQLQRIKLEINRHGHLEAQGLPRCTFQEIQPSTTRKALQACGPSLVGKGAFAASVALGQQSPFPAAGPLYAFNGTYRGHPAILAHVYGTDPVPTSFTLPFLIRPSRGTFGTALVASLPEATGDAGYVTGLSLDLGRTFRRRGATHSYLTAGCPAPAGFKSATFPFARATMTFRRGPVITSTIDRTCRVRS